MTPLWRNGRAKMSIAAMVFVRLLEDESGQDLIEYGLLAAIFGLGAFLVWPSIVPKIGNAFSQWGTTGMSPIWFPPDPAGP